MARRTSIVGRVRQIAEERLTEPRLEAAAISRALGISRASLYRHLRADGAPPLARLIRVVRLRRGLLLLLEGERTVSQVAADVGFSSLSQFSRSFKRAYGVAPSALHRNAELRETYADPARHEPR
jgi:AraC-like DNA-binding protein